MPIAACLPYNQGMGATLKACPQCGHQTIHWAPTCAACGHRYPASPAPAVSEGPSSALRDMARLKSYTGACVIVMLLYVFLFIPGIVANYLFLEDAKRMEELAGEALPGAGGLRLMWTVMLWAGGLLFGFFALAVIVGGNR